MMEKPLSHYSMSYPTAKTNPTGVKSNPAVGEVFPPQDDAGASIGWDSLFFNPQLVIILNSKFAVDSFRLPHLTAP
jgi:hypothetical protein